MRRVLAISAVALLTLVAGGSAADTFALRLVSQTSSTITLGWDPQPGYGYLFSTRSSSTAPWVLVSRTNDQSRTSVKFSKTYSYQVAVQVKGSAGEYPAANPPPAQPACSDGTDNDGDGKIDYPNDPGCSSATDTDETDPQPTPGWTFCANEGGRCSFTGTKLVRYGAGSSFNTGTFTGGVDCSNSTFGDPIVGTAKHCDYTDPPPPPPPPPPGSTLTGWQVTPQNIGLAPLGLSCASLAPYTGPLPIPAGTTITDRRISWSSGALDLNAGGITIQRSCMQPQPGAESTYVVVESFTPPQPNRIIDSELDGHLIGQQAMSKACGLRGIWAEITRTYVHHVGSGICLVDYNSSLSYDVTYTNNWIGQLVAYGDAAGSGSHNEAATTRCSRIDQNPNRRMTWKGNHIQTDTPANSSGGLFIQTTYGCPIGNLYVQDNLLDGGGNWDIYADGTGYSGQFVSTNNRFAPGGYGACAVSGFRWTTWTENYLNDPSAPDNKGISINGC